MSLKRTTKSGVLVLILVAAYLTVLPSASLGIPIAELERLSASGTLQELETAFSGTGADVVFPSGNNPLHVAAEHISDPAVIDLLVKHGASLSAKGLERLTPLMLAAAYNPNASITEALAKAGAEAGVEIDLADGRGRTPLYLAAALNAPPVVEVLLRHGAAPNVRDQIGRTPLWMAANRSNAQVVQLLLEAGARANEPNNDGITPLHVASENPDAVVLRLLVEAGADLNARGRNRYTPLMSAIAAGADLYAVQALIDGNADVNAEDDQNRSAILLLTSRRAAAPDAPQIITALVEAGADPNAMNSSLITPLMEACRQKNTAVVETLLKVGARVDLRDRNSWTPLLHAASQGAPLEIYEHLKKAGVDIDGSTRRGSSPLMVAMESDVDIEGLKALLDAGANPNYKGFDTISVLMNAIATQNVEIVKILLRYGADPNQSTWDGLAPMMLAAQRITDAAMFEALAAAGADIDGQSNQGVTALMVAANNANAVAVESLIALGADLEIKDLDGFTALFHAVQSSERGDSLLVMNLLIDGGSCLNAQDISGATPLMYAALGGKDDTARRLIDAGARIDATDLVGWTALHFAARSPTGANVTDFIIRKMSLLGKSVDIPDNGATTPLMVAAAHNNAPAVGLLLEAGASFSRRDNTGRSAYEYASVRNAPRARDVLRQAMDESQRIQTRPEI